MPRCAACGLDLTTILHLLTIHPYYDNNFKTMQYRARVNAALYHIHKLLEMFGMGQGPAPQSIVSAVL